MESSVRISRDFGRSKLFNTGDSVHDFLLSAFGRGIDHLRDTGKQQSTNWGYSRSDGGIQESQNVYVHRGGPWSPHLGLRRCYVDLCFWNGGDWEQHVSTLGAAIRVC